MSSPRPDAGSSYESLEDASLGRVLLISLSPEVAESSGREYLPEVAQEIQQERQEDAAAALYGPTLLQSENLERSLMAKLSNPRDPAQRPWKYLLESYGRASHELSSLALRNRDHAARLAQTLTALKQLLVSYSGLVLSMGMFPQPPEAEALGTRQLAESLQVDSLPSGFLADLALRFQDEGLEDMIKPAAMALAVELGKNTLLGDIQSLFNRMMQLLSIKPIAAALSKCDDVFMPAHHDENGSLAQYSLLGLPFSISPLPDPNLKSRPDLHKSFSASQGDAALRSQLQSMQALAAGYQGSLHRLVMLLLKPAATREAVLRWFAAVLDMNHGRAKLQVDPEAVAADGFFLNLSAVLLKCCEPFLEPMSGMAWGKIDARYVVQNERISFDQEETRLNANGDEQAALQERILSGQQAGTASSSYHFICECFFITAKGMHLGLLKVISACYEAVQKFQHLDGHRREMDTALASMPVIPPQIRARAEYLKGLANSAQEEAIMYQNALGEEHLLRNALAFYRLMAAWLLRMASPAVAAGHPVELPLPTPAPAEFRMLPEYFVEDLADMLLYIGRYKPKVLEGARLEELALFLLVFLASPEYVRNPYLRSKLAEVLLVWLPQQDEEEGFQPRGMRMRQSTASSTVANLFEGHPTVQQHMVRSLIQLYVDMEHTGRNTAFYEKFSTRHAIGTILSYLWGIPQHEEAWKRLAAEQGSRGLYMRFCHHLETDSIHLLDEAMKLLPEIREAELAMADASFSTLPPQQQQERQQTLHQHTRSIKADLDLAEMSVHVIRFSTTSITSTWLLPESVARIAAALNYFLMHLTGPGRKKLRVKEPEKYHWRPKELLASICSIYVHLNRADARGVFAAAIAADGRCYRPDMFPEAAQVLRSFSLVGEREVEELDSLAMRVAACAASAKAAEANEEDAPDDFWDPIMSTIMEDPVKLPSGSTVDRATILRHLLSDPTDPFNRAPLAEKDLVPDVDLKQRIDSWRAGHL